MIQHHHRVLRASGPIVGGLLLIGLALPASALNIVLTNDDGSGFSRAFKR